MPVALNGKGDWVEVTTETPGFINAGTYTLTLTMATGVEVAIDSLRFE